MSALTGRPIRELLRELTTTLRDMGLEGEDDFHNIEILCDRTRYDDVPKVNPLWPESRWTAVYALRGSNEGWYVHIDALSNLDPADYGRYEHAHHIGTMKVMVEEDAWQIARATARLLENKEYE